MPYPCSSVRVRPSHSYFRAMPKPRERKRPVGYVLVKKEEFGKILGVTRRLWLFLSRSAAGSAETWLRDVRRISKSL